MQNILNYVCEATTVKTKVWRILQLDGISSVQTFPEKENFSTSKWQTYREFNKLCNGRTCNAPSIILQSETANIGCFGWNKNNVILLGQKKTENDIPHEF